MGALMKAYCFIFYQIADTGIRSSLGANYAPYTKSSALDCRQYMVLDARQSRLALRPPHCVLIFLLTFALRTSFAHRTQGTTGWPRSCRYTQDCAYGVSLQAAAFTRKPTSATLRLFALCASRLTAHQSWRRLVCSASRCAAESVPPSAFGSLLTAFPKRIRLALLVRVHWGMRCAPTPIRQSPQAQCSTSRWSTPMVSLYTLIRFHYICPVQAARSSCLTVGNL